MNELKEQRFNYAQSNNQKQIKPNKVAIVFSWIGKSVIVFILKLTFWLLFIAAIFGMVYGLIKCIVPYLD